LTGDIESHFSLTSSKNVMASKSKWSFAVIVSVRNNRAHPVRAKTSGQDGITQWPVSLNLLSEPPSGVAKTKKTFADFRS